jgi:hypothetical protein
MLLGFKPRFVDPILDGTKLHTLRNARKVTPKVGEVLHMYTGLRTKHCKAITNRYTLKGIQVAHISVRRVKPPLNFISKTAFLIRIKVDGIPLQPDDIRKFCVADGFADGTDFASYWMGTAPKDATSITTTMDLFHWTDLKY